MSRIKRSKLLDDNVPSAKKSTMHRKRLAQQTKGDVLKKQEENFSTVFRYNESLNAYVVNLDDIHGKVVLSSMKNAEAVFVEMKDRVLSMSSNRRLKVVKHMDDGSLNDYHALDVRLRKR